MNRNGLVRTDDGRNCTITFVLVMNLFFLPLTTAFIATSCCLGAEKERFIYLDPAQPLEDRVEDLLQRLSLEEKISLIHGDSKFTTAAIPRHGLPRRWLSDGPHGVREDVSSDSWEDAGRTDDFSTCMPAGSALAATWNPELAQAEGQAIGEEARARGKDIMLGPAVNIMRTPLCGRNFEYMGEDPFLAARMAVGYIRGVQSRNVASCIKHFAANSQETGRFSVNVEMDERTLREIYLPAFKAGVQEAGVWTVMAAFNKFHGVYCCENDYLLNQILKREWGFKGLVVSDWNGTHDTRGAALGGLDLEMGTEEHAYDAALDGPDLEKGMGRRSYDDYYLARPFREALQKGEISVAVLDDKVRRNLRVMLAMHVLDRRAPGSLNTAQHQATARRVAEEAMVLLKNQGAVLPLDTAKVGSIAVIGENAVRLQASGGGSATIKAFYEITPLEGILRRIGSRVNVTYSVGYGRDVGADAVSRAVLAAKSADVALVIGGLNHDLGFDSEGRDRVDLKLPYGQDELIQRVVAANPRTIVVLVSGSPVDMRGWSAQVPAVLQAWYSGMEGGNALAAILVGDVNPSGKLPCTFPQQLVDSPAHAMGNFPGVEGTVQFKEGLLVGYRWFDTKDIEPLFPFGHGLSYTRFVYSELRIVENHEANGPVVTVEFQVANTGPQAGAEVAQLYVHDVQSRLPRPLKELKGFRKVWLRPGENQTISIPLGREALAYYDSDKHGWLAEAGDFTIMIGSSSRDLRLQGDFHLSQTTLEK